MAYAFYLDAAACSGCKACQIACQDKHALALGVRWRRVYEVSGGGWYRRGHAWEHDAYAYNLSVACNHCERPICVEVCPTGAMRRRADGLVVIDERRCLGCHYCQWACPYGAPQYDRASGRMTKCTGCTDELELGRPPACVAACGLRVLDFGNAGELTAKYGAGDVATAARQLYPDSPPLPAPALTGPGLLLAAHQHAARAAAGKPRVANMEEVRPGAPGTLREPSLVAFTLLTQLAIGLYWAWLALRWRSPSGGDPTGGLPLLAAGPLLLAGLLAALLHLGRPRHAWRAFVNLRTSWLSREILLTIMLLAGWAVVLVLEVDGRLPATVRAALAAAVALVGLGVVYAMARVYRLRTVPVWDTSRTARSFLLTALLLGGLGAGSLLALAGGELTRATVLAALFLPTAVSAVVLRVRFYAKYARTGL